MNPEEFWRRPQVFWPIAGRSGKIQACASRAALQRRRPLAATKKLLIRARMDTIHAACASCDLVLLEVVELQHKSLKAQALGGRRVMGSCIQRAVAVRSGGRTHTGEVTIWRSEITAMKSGKRNWRSRRRERKRERRRSKRTRAPLKRALKTPRKGRRLRSRVSPLVCTIPARRG